MFSTKPFSCVITNLNKDNLGLNKIKESVAPVLEWINEIKLEIFAKNICDHAICPINKCKLLEKESLLAINLWKMQSFDGILYFYEKKEDYNIGFIKIDGINDFIQCEYPSLNGLNENNYMFLEINKDFKDLTQEDLQKATLKQEIRTKGSQIALNLENDSSLIFAENDQWNNLSNILISCNLATNQQNYDNYFKEESYGEKIQDNRDFIQDIKKDIPKEFYKKSRDREYLKTIIEHKDPELYLKNEIREIVDKKIKNNEIIIQNNNENDIEDQSINIEKGNNNENIEENINKELCKTEKKQEDIIQLIEKIDPEIDPNLYLKNEIKNEINLKFNNPRPVVANYKKFASKVKERLSLKYLQIKNNNSTNNILENKWTSSLIENFQKSNNVFEKKLEDFKKLPKKQRHKLPDAKLQKELIHELIHEEKVQFQKNQTENRIANNEPISTKINNPPKTTKECTIDNKITPTKECTIDNKITPTKECKIDNKITPTKECTIDNKITPTKECKIIENQSNTTKEIKPNNTYSVIKKKKQSKKTKIIMILVFFSLLSLFSYFQFKNIIKRKYSKKINSKRKKLTICKEKNKNINYVIFKREFIKSNFKN